MARATATAAAPARQPSRRPATPAKRPSRRAPGRSVPRRASRTAAPRRAIGRAAPRTAAGRFALPFGTRVLDALLSGRVWIGLVGVLLAGIVFFNVDLLRMNREITHMADRAAQMKRENARLRQDVAGLASSERIQEAAAELGLVLPQPAEVRYLKSNPAIDARTASKRIIAPDPSVAPDPVVTEPPAATTTPPPTTTTPPPTTPTTTPPTTTPPTSTTAASPAG
jgi:cell division protein FtsL